MMAPLRIVNHDVSNRTMMSRVGDLALIVACITLACVGRASHLWSISNLTDVLPQVSILTAIGVISFQLAGFYASQPCSERNRVALRGSAAGATWAILCAVVMRWTSWIGVGTLTVAFALATATVAVIGWRLFLSFRPQSKRAHERVIFLGATPVAERLIAEIESRETGYEILGYVDDRPPHLVALTNGFKVLGTTAQLSEIATRTRAGTIVVALAERRGMFPTEAILDCKLHGVRVQDWPTFYEELTGKILVQDLRPSWLVFSKGFSRTRLTCFFKRLTDIFLSILFLSVTSPLLLALSIAVKLGFPGSIFVREERVGERGRIFGLLMFRTNPDRAKPEERDEGSPPFDSDHSRTRIGQFLERTHLDAIPQLFNVFCGQMSFIGPRPERPQYVAQMQERIPYYSQRQSIKPGLTGWAQVCHREVAPVEDAEEKLQYDLYYVKNLSVSLDLLILWSSIRALLIRTRKCR